MFSTNGSCQSKNMSVITLLSFDCSCFNNRHTCRLTVNLSADRPLAKNTYGVHTLKINVNNLLFYSGHLLFIINCLILSKSLILKCNYIKGILSDAEESTQRIALHVNFLWNAHETLVLERILKGIIVSFLAKLTELSSKDCLASYVARVWLILHISISNNFSCNEPLVLIKQFDLPDN